MRSGTAILCCCVLFVSWSVALGQDQNSSTSLPACSTICVAGVTWLNSDSGCCEGCSLCDGVKMYVEEQCTVTNDSVCGCASPTYFESKTGTCNVECTYCPRINGKPGKCVTDGTLGESRCKCKNPECHDRRDIYCDREECPLTIPATTSTRPQSDDPNIEPRVLPGWGIALIAVGIVVGIVLFATCFLCIGFITARRGSDPELRGSDASENGLYPQEAFTSTGTKTSFVSNTSSVYPYLSNHSMLQLLRNSNPQLVTSSRDRLSSLQSSPVSARSSPQPIRTVKLAKDLTTDRLTSVIV